MILTRENIGRFLAPRPFYGRKRFAPAPSNPKEKRLYTKGDCGGSCTSHDLANLEKGVGQESSPMTTLGEELPGASSHVEEYSPMFTLGE